MTALLNEPGAKLQRRAPQQPHLLQNGIVSKKAINMHRNT